MYRFRYVVSKTIHSLLAVGAQGFDAQTLFRPEAPVTISFHTKNTASPSIYVTY
ncbi:hypothetical protein YSA_07062 [Pseudomonas putida ND6]|uniref:Uncharacterized protein n=1 Tax=Pseudomonas putida ND6 TaxID=231023 RepID=I3UYL0_PSEPU|nr:hypothetical protein YSA_07062 [Pseudomonas putida ND6]